jgi:hypothetical protein
MHASIVRAADADSRCRNRPRSRSDAPVQATAAFCTSLVNSAAISDAGTGRLK